MANQVGGYPQARPQVPGAYPGTVQYPQVATGAPPQMQHYPGTAHQRPQPTGGAGAPYGSMPAMAMGQTYQGARGAAQGGQPYMQSAAGPPASHVPGQMRQQMVRHPSA